MDTTTIGQKIDRAVNLKMVDRQAHFAIFTYPARLWTDAKYLFIRYSRVSDVPLLKLALGINMNPADIEEGDDVYFECKIDANPTAYKVVWKHNVSCPRRVYVAFSLSGRRREAGKPPADL